MPKNSVLSIQLSPLNSRLLSSVNRVKRDATVWVALAEQFTARESLKTRGISTEERNELIVDLRELLFEASTPVNSPEFEARLVGQTNSTSSVFTPNVRSLSQETV